MFSVIFPGQGSQIVGMGKVLYDRYSLVKNLFKEADENLEFSISKLILDGPKEDLDLTENTQPAIFLLSYSIFKLAKEEFEIDLNKANFFAGHSLGEYSALASAQSLSFVETLKILKIRGKSMQSSVPKGDGGMVAVLGSKIETIEKIIEDNKDNYECFIANDNSIGQIVISGKITELEKLMIDLKSNNIKNVKLPVSAPFHCDLMAPAAAEMAQALSTVAITAPKVPLVCNVKAEAVSAPEQIRELLFQQITASIRWRESVQWMVEQQVSEIWEIGAGKALTGMVRRIDRAVACRNIATPDDISSAINT